MNLPVDSFYYDVQNHVRSKTWFCTFLLILEQW